MRLLLLAARLRRGPSFHGLSRIKLRTPLRPDFDESPRENIHSPDPAEVLQHFQDCTDKAVESTRCELPRGAPVVCSNKLLIPARRPSFQVGAWHLRFAGHSNPS